MTLIPNVYKQPVQSATDLSHKNTFQTMIHQSHLGQKYPFISFYKCQIGPVKLKLDVALTRHISRFVILSFLGAGIGQYV